MTRQQRQEAEYLEASGKHFDHFKSVFDLAAKRAKAAAVKKQNSDRAKFRSRDFYGLCQSGFCSRLATQIFRRRDLWPWSHVECWLRRLGQDTGDIEEIRLAFERQYQRLAQENPNTIVCPIRLRKKPTQHWKQ